MSEKLRSIEHKVESLELSKEDRDLFEKLEEVFVLQEDAIRVDKELRDSLLFDEEEFNEICERCKFNQNNHTPSKRARPSNLPQFGTQADIDERKRYLFQEITSVLPDELVSRLDFDEMNEKYYLVMILEIIKQRIAKFCEPSAEKWLSVLHRKMFGLSDMCFKTSQEGSATSTPESRKNPKYDSIYYLFKLSNGTYLSQRHKRNMILKHGLDEVIQPFAFLALFIKDGNIDGLRLPTGQYTNEQMSVIPKIGYDLYEYFNQGVPDSVLDGDFNPAVPDVVSINKEGVLVKKNLDGESFELTARHQGTEVNLILK